MVLVSTSFCGKWKRYWQKKRYQRLDSPTYTRMKIKIIRFGGSPRRVWKIKVMPKLRKLTNINSAMKLLSKVKNAFADMMPRGGSINTTSVIGDIKAPKGIRVKSIYPSEEFEKRLVYEIYKNFLASRELYTE